MMNFHSKHSFSRTCRFDLNKFLVSFYDDFEGK